MNLRFWPLVVVVTTLGTAVVYTVSERIAGLEGRVLLLEANANELGPVNPDPIEPALRRKLRDLGERVTALEARGHRQSSPPDAPVVSPVNTTWREDGTQERLPTTEVARLIAALRNGPGPVVETERLEASSALASLPRADRLAATELVMWIRYLGLRWDEGDPRLGQLGLAVNRYRAGLELAKRQEAQVGRDNGETERVVHTYEAELRGILGTRDSNRLIRFLRGK